MKTCSKCQILKPLTAFAKNSEKKDGLRSDCKECRKSVTKNYYDTNKDKILPRIYKRIKNKLQSDPKFRMTHNVRCRIRYVLKNNKKANHSIKLLGCTFEQLKQHLERQFKNGMSWDNYGDWHVDHIRPCALFDLSDAKQQQECFHYSNLQPLWAKENLSKGDAWQPNGSI